MIVPPPGMRVWLATGVTDKRAAASAACTVSGAATLCEAAAQLEGLVDPNLKAAYDDATWEARFSSKRSMR